MGNRLVDIITCQMLSLPVAFSRLDADKFAAILRPSVEQSIREVHPHGDAWMIVIGPLLHRVLKNIVIDLQRDRHIEEVLDLREVVASAFVANVELLVDLFLNVGRVELDFLVISGLYWGFALGIGQMILWIFVPRWWMLPACGTVVGYITNWIAIKLIFDPVEPYPVGPFVFQGLFEQRQPEVSTEFAQFLVERVLSSPRLIHEMSDGLNRDRFQEICRRNVPFVVPDSVVAAAVEGVRRVPNLPRDHSVHTYVDEALDLEADLCEKLKRLPCKDFENLLHPVFQEDEIYLILAGAVLGFATGSLQVFFWLAGRRRAALAAKTAIPRYYY